MDKKEIFLEAIQHNQGLIYKIAAVYTNNSEDRNDLVQEIIFQLWKSFDSFRQRSALTTWMYRVSMNVAILHLKIYKRKLQTVPLDEHILNLEDPSDRSIEEKWQELKAQLNQLNLLDRGIVMLYLEDKSYEEISEITGLSVSNTGTRLSRIKEKLKQQLSKQL